jgi:glycosyltransferase involved in cell wall biosynthesis/2-polyprenyl-3-methyl-5-hydroxy-6-metoxy-1,4-benzoquinol methylase
MTTVGACTIIARNYLAHARVLAESFFQHHPRGRFAVLIVDDEARSFIGDDESFNTVRLSDIGIDHAEIGRLAAVYDVTELATAVKPLFLRHLLRTWNTSVLYLDPDIKIYGSLVEVTELAEQHQIVLTPHMTSPLPRDGRRIDDYHILSSGVYNLGFIGLGRDTDVFIDWWWNKTRRNALVDHDRMMFTDQRWIDFVPSFFKHHILKNPAYNVAYWNLHSRRLTCEAEHYFVDGQPLKFFHFSGFDTGKPYLLSRHQAERPRILLSEHPDLARICNEYAASLKACGLARASNQPYGWDRTASGLLFDRRIRRLYRAALEEHERGEASEPPNPFDCSAAQRFVEWLNEPVAVGLHPRVSRYLYSIYESRIDLQRAFPDLADEDCARYLDWVHTIGVIEEQVPALLLPERAAPSSDVGYVPVSDLARGVNIAGYFRAELGIGEAARLLRNAVDAADIPNSTIAYGLTLSRKTHPFIGKGHNRAPYDINIVCVNSDRTPQFAKDVGKGFFEGRYTVGYWFWELEQFPTSMHVGFDHVDEVWAATDFANRSIAAIGRRPVHTVPVPILVPSCSAKVTRETLGLPSGFLFLFVFDFFSILERKNPIGLIRAFEEAFRPDEGPCLVIKTINGHYRLSDLERIRAATEGRRDILVLDEYYAADAKNSLVGLCDCYVSLHRSEGLGLTMGEAMGLGKPVIATGYSGNLAFMTPANSYLVDYVMGAVPESCDPYPKGAPWAEPDVSHAADLMRRVYSRPRDAARKGEQARHDILTKHNASVAGAAVARRLDDIRKNRVVTNMSSPAGLAELSPLSEPQSTPNSLDALIPLLTPTASASESRPYRRAALAAQRLLFRILRPYWWQQRQIQLLFLERLRTTRQQIVPEAHQRQALEALWNSLDGLHGDRIEIETRIRELEHASTNRDERMSSAEARIRELEHASTNRDAWTSSAETRLAELDTASSSFEKRATSHLQALTDQLETAVSRDGVLSARLYASPYMSDPERFCYIDDLGKPRLGFRSRPTVTPGSYADFEDIFRGTEPFIRGRFRAYLPLLRAHSHVVEVGCGRGEVLDLLRDEGVSAIGVDIDAAMVQRCLDKGHRVEKIDGVTYLEHQPDSSLSAVFAAQVVEHLTYDELMRFLELSVVKLKDGGQLIFETVNPHSLEAFKTFWTDLTHQKPIFPEVAVALCWLVGFGAAYVLFPNGGDDLEANRRTQGEYAVIATKTVRSDSRLA